jgi:urocanate hydratase
VINGGFGLVLDGSDASSRKLRNMLYFDVNNGIARRAWARNEHAVSTINREAGRLTVTPAHRADDDLIDRILP